MGRYKYLYILSKPPAHQVLWGNKIVGYVQYHTTTLAGEIRKDKKSDDFGCLIENARYALAPPVSKGGK